jgi:hypothetical protein
LVDEVEIVSVEEEAALYLALDVGELKMEC